MPQNIGGWTFVDDNPYGITIGVWVSGKIIPQIAIDDAVGLGASRIRLNISAILVETAKGVFDWSTVDDCVQKCNIAGLRVTMTIREFGPHGGGTSWATLTTPCESGINYYFGQVQNFVDYAVAVGKRYSGDGGSYNAKATNGTNRPLIVDNIEVGNEDFDVHGTANGGCRNPMRYVQYARAIVSALRKPVAQGGAGWTRRIGMWGMWEQRQAHILNVLQTLHAPPADPTYNPNGDHSSVISIVDYVNFHNYDTQNVDTNTVSPYDIYQEVTDIRNFLDTNGYPNTPVWCTEFGAVGPVNGTSAQSQSDYYNNSSGKGALDALRRGKAQHADLYTCDMGGTYNASTGYQADIKCIAGYNANTSTYDKFLAYTTIKNYITQFPGSVSNPWPYPFPGSSSSGSAAPSVSPTSLAFTGVAGVSDPGTQSITLTNVGTAAGNWSASVTMNNGTGWLSVSPVTGSSLAISGTQTITVAASNLAGNLVAGTYTGFVTVTMGGTSAKTTVILTVTASGPGQTGTLHGSVTHPSAAVNLTTEGVTDWAHWGLNTVTDFDHKANGGSKISNYTPVGAGKYSRDASALVGYSWNDGTPNNSTSGSSTGVSVTNVNDGFQITVPATLTMQTLNVYVDVAFGQSQLTAHLSDGSAPDYVDSSLNNTSTTQPGVYTLSFQAASNSATLTVTYILLNGSTGGNGQVVDGDTFTRPNNASSWGGPTSTSSATPALAPTQAASPAVPNIMMVLMENRAYSDVIGNTAIWPHVNALANTYGLATSYYGVSHPSLPNYLALLSGSTQGVTTDTATGPFSGNTLVDSLDGAAISWKAYMESMPSTGYTGGDTGNYVKHHNPFVYFSNVLNNSSQLNKVVPYSQFSSDLANNPASFIWITPNVLDDAHNTTDNTGDNFINGLVTKVQASSWYTTGKGTIIIVFDEGLKSDNSGIGDGVNPGGGHTVCVVIGENSKGVAQFSKSVNHYGLIKAIEEQYNITQLKNTAHTTNGDLTPLFGSGTVTPPPPGFTPLPGQYFVNNVSNYLFGINTPNYNTSLTTNPGVQQQINAGNFTVIRCSINDSGGVNYTNAQIDALMQGITNAGAVPLVILRYSDLTFSLNTVTYLASKWPFAKLFELGNEPDINGISVSQYTTAWNSIIPQCRAANPNAAFIGPVLGVYGNVDSYLIPWLQNCVTSGVMPDGVSYHDYPCTSTSAIPQSTCAANAPGIGHAGSTLRQKVISTAGYNIPICCTEWNIDAYYSNSNAQSYSTNIPANASFISSFTTAALDAMAADGLDMACEFELNYYLVDDNNPTVTAEPQYQAMVSEIAKYLGPNSGEQWSQNIGTSGAVTGIVNNQGQLSGPANAQTVALLGANTVQDIVASVVTTVSATGDTTGVVGRATTSARSYYAAQLIGGNFKIVYVHSGTTTTLATQSATYSAGTQYSIALQVSGNTLSASYWLATQSQPASWMLTVNDGNLTGAGQYGVCGVIVGGTDTILYDNFSVTNLALGGSIPADVSLQAATLFPSNSTPPPTTSSLTGSFSTPTGTINLTNEGTNDWAHWGYGAVTGFDHKANVGQEVSAYTPIGNGTVTQGTAALLGFSWGDGTPDGTVTGSTTEIDVQGTGNGFSFTVPLLVTKNTLNVYVAVNNAQGQLTATLNDGSGLNYVDSSLNSTGKAVRKYTLAYNGANSTHTMTVQWVMLTDNGSTGSGTGTTTTYASDTFTRPNQSGWGTASDGTDVWNLIASSGTFSITNNKGQVTSTTGGPQPVMQCGTQTQANVESVVDVTVSNIADSAGMFLRQTGTTTYYRGRISAGTLYISKYISGTDTALASASFTINTGTAYTMRFRVDGTNLYLKLWAKANTEPSKWTLTATDSSITGAGGFGVRAKITNANDTVSFDNYTATSVPSGTSSSPGSIALQAATIPTPLVQSEQIFVPAYAYPTDPGGTGTTWAQYEQGAPTVALAAINPANGPGTSADQNYITGIAAMQQESIDVLGYVDTAQAANSLASVEAQIDSWYNFYTINGIFFDNVSATSGNFAYYQSLFNYVRGKSTTNNYVMFNIGSVPPSTYMPILDTCIVFNDVIANLGNLVTQSYMASQPNSKFCAIVQNVQTVAQVDSTFNTLKNDNICYLYLTDQSGATSFIYPPSSQIWQETITDCGGGANYSYGQLTVSPSSFTDGNYGEVVTLTNNPANNGTAITWTATPDTPDVLCVPSSGTLNSGQSVTVKITYNQSLIAPNVVNITFAATNNTVIVPWIAPSASSPNVSYPSLASLQYYKHQMVYVYSPSGTFLDVWRDAPLLAGFKETINSATTPLRLTLPRSFDNFDQVGGANSRGTVAQGNVVQFWLYGPSLPPGGLLRFQGVIDSYEPQIDSSGAEVVIVTITPFDSVLGDRGVTVDNGVTFGTPGNATTYVDPVTMFNYFFTSNDSVTGLPYMNPLSLDPTNPTSSGTKVQFSFLREVMGDVFNQILFLLPSNWFYRTNPNKTVTLNVSPSVAQHTFYIGQNIVNPSYTQDWNTLRNVIVLKAGIISGSQYYAHVQGSDISTFGERLKLVEESRITDTNSAAVFAQGYLNAFDRANLRVKVRVPDFRGDNSGLGYDIETLRVGDTVQILDTLSTDNTKGARWDSAIWNKDYWDATPGDALNQVTQIQALDYQFDYVDLELGLLQPSQDRALFQLQQRLQLYSLS